MKRRSPVGFTLRLAIPKFILILLIFTGLHGTLQAQVDVTSSGGTPMASYATLSAAFAAVNAGTHTGTITMNITGNTAEPAGGAILNGNGIGATNFSSMLIKPNGGAARTISGAATAGLPLIDLNGADNVTIDGLNSGGNALTIENTTISAVAGTSTIRFQTDATNDVVTNCTINGASTMSTTTTGGNIWIAAGAITTGNDNITISNSKIGPSAGNLPTKSIFGLGSAGTSTLFNSNVTINNCEIFDFFNTTAQSNGIYVGSGNTNWNITNNKFYQTASRTQTTAALNNPIQLSSTDINGCVITGNTIGFANASGTGVYTLTSTVATTFVGINVAAGPLSPTSIQGNIISSISNTTSSGVSTGSGILCGIAVTSGDANIGTTSGNTIGSGSVLNSLSAVTSTSTGSIVGINAGTTGTINIQNNTFGGFQCQGSTTAIATGVLGITVSAVAANISIVNNTIGNALANNMVAGVLGTTTGATIAIGINATSVPNIANYSNNTIQNFASLGSGTGNARGIFTSTTAGAGTVHTISNNTIKNISTNSSLTSATSGLTAAAGIHFFPGTNALVSNNTIFNIMGLNTGALNTVITGIASANTTNVTYSGNRIYDITNASTSTTVTSPGVAAGITIRSGTTACIIVNNMISLGTGQATNTAFVGIWGNHGSTPNPIDAIYFNSVNITGVVGSGAQSSFCFMRGDYSATARTATVDIRDNIFTNDRIGGTGNHCAIGNNFNATASTTGWPANASNFNVLNANVLTVGWWNAALTFSGWKTTSAGDGSSYSGISVPYVNPANDLHLNFGMTPTVIESGATPISGVNVDFDNQTRPGPPGSSKGGGVFPDIGADEIDAVPLDLLAPIITYNPLISACGTGNQTLSGVTIQDVSGVPTTGTLKPRIYYRKGAGSWFSQPGTLTSGTGQNGVWMFTIVASDMGGLAFGDVISYYVIAQDIASPTNISSNPAGAVAIDVNNVTTPPSTPNMITVSPVLNGTYTVGVGGNYTTLTAAVAAYNLGCLSGPVIFQLTDATYPSEVFPITINNINATSATPLTIKPGPGVNATISGTSATGLIVFNGAKFVTINGSNGNTVNSVCPNVSASRNLTITNTNTSTTSAVVWLQWNTISGVIQSPNNIQILNCNISGNGPAQTLVGIGSGSTTISTATLGFHNDNNSFINNNISNCQLGIMSIGQSAGTKNIGNIVNQNLINSASPTNVQTGGIFVGFEDNILISGNNVSGMNLAGSPDVFGINAGFTFSGFSATSPGTNECTNVTISNNLIGSITNSGTFSAVGIALGATSSGTSLISNNMISGVNANGTAGDIGIGLVIGGGTGNVKVYHNTIAMQGAITGTSAASQTSACLGFTSSTVPSSFEMKNNIFTNTQIGNTGATLRFAAVALGYSSNVGNYLGTISDNNDFYVAGAGPGTYTLGITGGVVAGTSRLTLTDWRNETGKDFTSQNVLPSYVSATDLHLTATGNDCLNQAGMPLTLVPSDIDCQTRSLTNPDIGADEFTAPSNLTITVTENSGIPNDKNVCVGSSATITVTGGTAHKWNTGETTNAITKTPAVTTIYFDTVTISAGCLIVMSDTIKVLPLPPAMITPANVTICSGLSTTLTASGGGTYLWNTGAVTTAITVTPASTTSYTVTVTSSAGCTATATATVTVNPSPTAVITPAAPSICPGATQTLTASGGTSFLWSTGANTAPIMVTPPSTTTYTVTVTAANGCTNSKTATVTVLTGVGITETHVEPTSCGSTDGSINITATGSGGFTYMWATPDGFGTLNPTAEDQSGLSVGTYNVTVTANNGCTATKTIALIGPGNCGGCPSIGSLSTSVSTVCKTTNFTLTASGLSNMGGIYGIVFKYSLVALPDPYTGGTILGTVPNSGLTNGGSTAVLVANIPVNGNYFLYAIVTPNPPNPNCRPSASNSIVVLSCTAIMDPCSCKNNATTLTNGQFNETVTINAPSGQTWTVSSAPGFFLSTSPAPPAAPLPTPAGSLFTETPLGNGISNYIRTGVHVDASGYTVTATNGSVVTSIGGTCYYPNPTINGLATVYCQNDPPVTLNGSAQLGDNSGPAMGVGTFTVNGAPATVFDPGLLGPGTHNVVFTFDAADGVPNANHPGCIQAVSQSVVVNQTPTINAVTNKVFCVGQTSALITFTGAPAGAVFNWTRTPELIGLASTSGSGSVPSFVTTNAGSTPLTSTFTVTPTFTNAGKTCTGTPLIFTITVNPTPTANQVPDVQYCHGDATVAINFTGFAPGTTYTWTRTPEPIGLAALNGTNTVPSFITTNPSAARITSTFTVIPSFTNGGVTCTGNPMTFRISVLPQPVARCKNATIYLDKNGLVNLTVPDVDNGSTGARTLTLSKSAFACGDVGNNTVTLTATDSCGKFSTCTSTVTVLDTIRPVLWCPKDWTINLNPGECDRIINYNTPEATDNCTITTSTTTATIVTAYNSNNQFAGNMWDIKNVSSGPITITSIATNIIGTVGGICQGSLYYTPNTYVGNETNPAAWTLMATGNGTCAGLNLPTLFPTIGGLVIQPGQSFGLFFYLDSYPTYTLRYTNGSTTYNNGDLQLTLGVGKGNPVFTGATFLTRIWNGTINYTKQQITGAPPVVTQIDNSGKHNGDVFPRGTTCQTYRATDFSGNSTACTFCITVQEYQSPVNFITCHDEIEVSLNENCIATIGADEVLSGGPYGCYNDYVVIVQDWSTGQIIDRQPNVPGIQLGVQDINKEYKITIKDTATGNSCWAHAKVEDKLAPKMVCARDTCIVCGTSPTTPLYMGTPIVIENCGSYSLTYEDNVTNGSCALNFDQKIVRTWTAVDAQGNKTVCVQTITVALATVNGLSAPHDYDDNDEPALSCDGKINKTKDYTPHYLASPYCVDGYLLDSALWKATGGFYPSPQGDLAGVRLPRILGWNCIDTGLYEGHPSPFPVYYPAHPSWRPTNPVCWGPDEVIMWQGTGYPTGRGCFNLGMTFRDIKIDVANPGCDAGAIGCFKIIRQWTVLDWCTGTVGGHNQIIKVIDKEGPQVVYPDTVVVLVESFKCSGIWEVPKPWLVDNCSNEVHYSVKISSGDITGNETDGFVIRNIERGIISTAYIIAEDCCGNITKHRVAVSVLDNIAPFANCDQHTIATITGNQSTGENFVRVYAKDLDQGSIDNCSPHVFFKAIRMENLRGTNNGTNSSQPDNGTNCYGVNGDDNSVLDGNQIYFDDYINFCCTDVGKSYLVVFRVFDIDPGDGPVSPSRMNANGNLYGHYNDCMVEVEIQDKSVPTVTPPPNIVVSCWFWFDVDKLSDPNDATFGRVVSDLSLRNKVITNDLVCHRYCERNDITGYPGFVPGAPPSNPPAWNKACDYYRVLFDTAHADRKYNLTWGFDGTVLGTCGVNFNISVNDNRECGQGQLTRTIVARGPNGLSVTATQTIWVVDCDPFYINRADNCDDLDDITWPGNCNGKATTIEGCGANISPDNPILGRPVIENNADDLCALISIEYVDEIFTIEPDACFKVLRTWVVIDWCQYDPSIDPVKGRWEYLQIIKVHDTDKPEITITVGNCEAAAKNQLNNICYGHIELTADATDNCSPADWLFYDYKIDLYNDGIGQYNGFDVKSGPLTRKDYEAGKKPYFHDNPFAENENNPFDASGTYPVGIHKICWYVEDGCSNIASLCQLFEIKDCKAPTPYCEVGVVTTVMPKSGCITIWAKDLDRGSFDNCTDKDNLKFYFDGDPTLTSITICCDDFTQVGANDELIKEVRLWVEDEQGNKDFCVTAILVQDPQNVCPNSKPFGKIIGDCKTETNQSTEKVETRLFQSGLMTKRMTTSSTGQYFFGDLAYGSSMQYVIKPVRDDEPTNGVTTADIVRIQRHILGIESLNSPYKLIAADVNNTNNITASDISEIRKLILGVTEKFAKNDSWTFVPVSYVFPDKLNPYNAPREIAVNVIDPVTYQADFMAIKMGDVTNSAKAHSATSSIQRTGDKLHFEIENGKTTPGELYRVQFKSSDFNNIIGYQFTLKFDQKNLAFETIEEGELKLDLSNFGTNRIDDGILTTSWNNKTAQTVSREGTLFTVVFRALTSQSISSLLAITSDVTAAEAYDANLGIKDVNLGVRTNKGFVETGVFELYQNTPNPFTKSTVINFRLPEEGDAKLSIYDITGKVLRIYDVQGIKGMNSVKVDKSDLNVNGVLYYQLDAASHTATRQMILMN